MDQHHQLELAFLGMTEGYFKLKGYRTTLAIEDNYSYTYISVKLASCRRSGLTSWLAGRIRIMSSLAKNTENKRGKKSQQAKYLEVT